AADEPAAEPRGEHSGEHREPYRLGVDRKYDAWSQVNRESERNERACVGTDAEERNMPERKLAGVAEQQIQAHRRDDENPGHDQEVQDVWVAHPKRNRGERENPRGGSEFRRHPILSLRAKRPVGRKSRITMIRRKPIASR